MNWEHPKWHCLELLAVIKLENYQRLPSFG